MLAGGFVVVSRCYHAALRSSTFTTLRQDAVICAQNRLRAMRAWSQANHHPIGSLDMDDWGPYAAGGPTADPADPRFMVTTVISNPTFYDSCSKFELVEPTSTTRYTLATERRQITLRVSWGSNQSINLTTLICAPAPKFAHQVKSWQLLALLGSTGLLGLWPRQSLALDLPLTPAPPAPSLPPPNLSTCFVQLYQGPSDASPSPTTLAHNQVEAYRGELQCQSGGVTRTLPARVSWSVLGPGNGTLTPLRGSNRVNFRHQIKVSITAAPGYKYYYTDNLSCRLRCTAKYAGLIVTADTPPISLVP